MTNISTIRKIKCPLALCVIVSFVLVYGCDILCDLGVISFSLPNATVVSTTSPQHATSHDHSGSGNHDHKTHDHSTKHDHDAQQGSDECCDDLTQQFYSSLVNSPGNATLLLAEGFKLICIVTLPDISNLGAFKDLIVDFSYDNPSNGPPGLIQGQHLRILFCTFLI